MVPGVVPDAHARSDLRAHEVRVALGELSDHEERRGNVVAMQQPKDLRGIRGRRPVVEGERHRPRRLDPSGRYEAYARHLTADGSFGDHLVVASHRQGELGIARRP